MHASPPKSTACVRSVAVCCLALGLWSGALDGALRPLGLPASGGVALAKDGGSDGGSDGGGSSGGHSGESGGSGSSGSGSGRSGSGSSGSGSSGSSGSGESSNSGRGSDDGEHEGEARGGRDGGASEIGKREDREVARFLRKLDKKGAVAWSREDRGGIAVRYADGWMEIVAGGRYRLIDRRDRTVSERPARSGDLRRLRAASSRQ